MIRKLKEIVRILITSEKELFRSPLPEPFFEEVAFLTNPLDEKAINYSMNISLQHRFVFVETPKVACSTIKLSLKQLELKDATLPKGVTVHRRRLSPLLQPTQVPNLKKFVSSNDVFKFRFVRNPYSLSAYLDKMFKTQASKRELLKRMGRNHWRLNQYVSFADFVQAISRLNSAQKDPHWREQYQQVMYSKIDYDFVGYFETLDEDLGILLEKILPGGSRYNCRNAYNETNACNKLHEHYTQEILDQVNRIYAKDFETFGYVPFKKLPTSIEAWEAGLKASTSAQGKE